jgi:hypothetical protein
MLWKDNRDVKGQVLDRFSSRVKDAYSQDWEWNSSKKIQGSE